jgi:hypothetical protein
MRDGGTVIVGRGQSSPSHERLFWSRSDEGDKSLLGFAPHSSFPFRLRPRQVSLKLRLLGPEVAATANGSFMTAPQAQGKFFYGDLTKGYPELPDAAIAVTLFI